MPNALTHRTQKEKNMLTDLTTYDYLFLKYRSIHIKLEDIVTEYYPNLCRENMLTKARQQKFPFTCFRIDESQKGAFFVSIYEFAKVIDKIYSDQHSIFQNRTQKAIKSLN